MSRFFSSRFASLAPYVPGEQPQDQQYVKLNTNESPYPPSPRTRTAVSDAELARLNLYPDPTGTRLREALAARYGVKPANVLLANGSDEILSFAFMAFCDAETPVAFPDISYGFYPVYAALYGLAAEEIPLRADFSMDVDAFCASRGMRVLANPNAPTGMVLPLSEIERILSSDPDRVVLVDEAYVDFGGESCIPLIKKYRNLLVTQTFSKSRSMAGARLGLGAGCPELIEDLRRMKYSTNPYNVNSMTMAAGIGALSDPEYTEKNCRIIEENREYTAKKLREMGFEVCPSKTNFLFVRHGKIAGEKLYRELKARGILVRHFGLERIREYNRVTIGTKDQMERFFEATESILKEPV